KLFLAVVSRDFETLAVVYTDIGTIGKNLSLRDFQLDIRDLLLPNLDRPLREINIGQLLLDSARIARRHQVQVPRELILVYRSLMTLEHIGRKLDPDFEFLRYGEKFAKSLVKRRFSGEELYRDLIKMAEGFRSFGTEFPSQI